jgi:hypothetical protein
MKGLETSNTGAGTSRTLEHKDVGPDGLVSLAKAMDQGCKPGNGSKPIETKETVKV